MYCKKVKSIKTVKTVKKVNLLKLVTKAKNKTDRKHFERYNFDKIQSIFEYNEKQ